MNKYACSLGATCWFLAISLLSCGGGMSGTRMLQSIAVTPSTAVAPTSGAQVQFSASGQYTAPPSPSKVMNASWCVSDSNGCTVTSNVTIDSSGLAQCDPSFSGTVTVRAMASNGAGAP